MAMESGTSSGSRRPPAVAPWWHTAMVAGLFIGLAIAGAFFQRAALEHPGTSSRHPSVAPLYISLIALEWGLLAFVSRRGLRRTGTTLADLVGGRWRGVADVARDVAIAIAILALWKGISTAWVRVLGEGHAASIGNLLPRGPVEIPLWIALSVSAGICEEIVFRGYFQRQFESLTGMRWLAWLLQSLLFGVSHGYQGVMACARIAAYGGLFGLVALWRRSLRPGMLAHALTDLLSGLFGV